MKRILTHYDTLKVSRDAPSEVIRAAFKSLSQKYHPDKNPHPDAVEITQKINEAYSILSNQFERIHYDEWLRDLEKQETLLFQERLLKQSKSSQNKIIEIHIPSNISLRNLRIFVSNILSNANNSSSKLTRALSRMISSLLTIVAKLLMGGMILWLVWFLFSIFNDSNNRSNAAEEVAAAQQEIEAAQRELAEATLDDDWDNRSNAAAEVAAAQQEIEAAQREIVDATLDGDWDNRSNSTVNSTASAQEQLDEVRSELAEATFDDNDVATTRSNSTLPLYQYRAPNGQPYPSTAGHISGYPKLNSDGLSVLTVDNSRNSTAIFGKLYYLDSYKPNAVRYVYIPAWGGLKIRDISPGRYDFRYKDLNNGQLAKTESFQVQELQNDYGTRYSEIEMTIYKVANGNMQTYNISESEF